MKRAISTVTHIDLSDSVSNYYLKHYESFNFLEGKVDSLHETVV